MTVIITILILVVFYLFSEVYYLKKKIRGELEFQKWSNAFSHAIKQNRENVLTPEQWKVVNKWDEVTERKFNNEIQPPNKPTLRYD